MGKYLSIVESAYRATMEEQDDTAMWFTHAMKIAGADVAILLRGDAVNYAVKGQNARGLLFGSRTVQGPDMVRDVGAMLKRSLPMYVVAEDLAVRGIDTAQLVSGVEPVSKNALGGFIAAFDRVLAF